MIGASGLTFLVVGYPLVSTISKGDQAVPDDDLRPEDVDKEITAWVNINTQGRITIYNPAAEMGQGSMTALPVLIAEEMDADWANVTVEYSPVEPTIYGRSWGRGRGTGGTMLTVGSHAVSGYFDNLRHAGAQVRYVLLKNASKEWDIAIEELATEPGFVVHPPSSRKISYGDIVKFAEIPDTIRRFRKVS